MHIPLLKASNNVSPRKGTFPAACARWPRLGELQATIDTKPADANFEPKTSDVEIKEKTRTFSDQV